MKLYHLFEQASDFWFVLVKGKTALVLPESDFARIVDLEKSDGWKIVTDSARTEQAGYAYAKTHYRALPAKLGVGQSNKVDKAFKAWFRHSKVVDAAGKPLRVYHGTIRDFAAFQYIEPKGVGGAGWGMNRIGFWFDTDPRTANTFADTGASGSGGVVLPVYLSIQKPLVIISQPVSAEAMAEMNRLRANYFAADADRTPDPYGNNDDRRHRAKQAYDACKARFEQGDAFTKLLKTVLPQYDRTSRTSRDGHTAAVAAVQQKLISKGYDGILLRDTLADSGSRDHAPSDWWIAFHPTQIKSAVGNRGSFDATNPAMVEAAP